MSLVLTQILDPRDKLERANRCQIWEFCDRNNIKEVTWDMPGNQMRAILRSLKIYDLGLPLTQLGASRHVMTDAAGPPADKTVNLEDHERQQWKRATEARENVPGTDIKGLTRAQLAHQCKERGIKMGRKDTKEILIEKLNGQSHAA